MRSKASRCVLKTIGEEWEWPPFFGLHAAEQKIRLSDRLELWQSISNQWGHMTCQVRYCLRVVARSGLSIFCFSSTPEAAPSMPSYVSKLYVNRITMSEGAIKGSNQQVLNHRAPSTLERKLGSSAYIFYHLSLHEINYRFQRFTPQNVYLRGYPMCK